MFAMSATWFKKFTAPRAGRRRVGVVAVESDEERLERGALN